MAREKGTKYTGIAVIFVCHDGKGNVVLSKRGEKCIDENGTWDPGGGSLEFGEKIEDALVREIKEEYCADVLEQEFLGYRDVHREHEGKKTHWLALDFKVLVDPGQVKNGELHKFDAVEWFHIDSLPEPLHSQAHNTLESFRKTL